MLLLRDREPVHLNFQMVVDPDAIDAVGLRRQVGLWRCVYGRTVDEVLDLVRHDAHFERVGGRAAGIGHLHGVVGRFRRHALS